MTEERTFIRYLNQFEDRCDVRNCGAQALVIAFKVGAGELTFCGHHGNKLYDELLIAGFDIQIDELDTNEEFETADE